MYISSILVFLCIVALAKAQKAFLKAQDSGWYPQFLQPVIDKILNTPQSKLILDIGTGPGKLPEMLIGQDPGLQITAIDIESSMIAVAKKRVVHKNISFQLEKINAPLNFPDNQFDIVTICSVLFLVDDSNKTSLINEALRVLKPKGKIIVLTPSGRKTTISSFAEVWHYPYTSTNWTFIVWKIFTTKAARSWQRNKWLAGFASTYKYRYSNTLTFNNNATIEDISKD